MPDPTTPPSPPSTPTETLDAETLRTRLRCLGARNSELHEELAKAQTERDTLRADLAIRATMIKELEAGAVTLRAALVSAEAAAKTERERARLERARADEYGNACDSLDRAVTAAITLSQLREKAAAQRDRAQRCERDLRAAQAWLAEPPKDGVRWIRTSFAFVVALLFVAGCATPEARQPGTTGPALSLSGGLGPNAAIQWQGGSSEAAPGPAAATIQVQAGPAVGWHLSAWHDAPAPNAKATLEAPRQ